MNFTLPRAYRRMMAPVFAPSLLMAVSQEAAMILLPLYVLDQGGSAALAAMLVGVRGFGLLAFDVPAGALAARFGDRPILLFGLGSMLVGLLTLAFAPALWAFVPAAFLLGTGHAAWILGRTSYITQVSPRDEIGQAITGMAGLQRVGAFAGPALGGLIAGAFGYPAAFIAGAACAAAAAAFVIVYAREEESTRLGAESMIAGLAAVVHENRGVLATAGSAALSLQLTRATRQLLVPLFGAAIGLDTATIGLLYALSAAIDMSLFYPVGIVVDRFGRKWSAVPSLLLYALGFALLPFATGFGSLLAVALLLGLANGLGTGVVMIVGSDLAAASGRRAQFLGVWRLIGDIGMSGAPLISGALVKVSGLALAAGATAGIGLAGALVMAFVVTETLTAKAAEPTAAP